MKRGMVIPSSCVQNAARKQSRSLHPDTLIMVCLNCISSLKMGNKSMSSRLMFRPIEGNKRSVCIHVMLDIIIGNRGIDTPTPIFTMGHSTMVQTSVTFYDGAIQFMIAIISQFATVTETMSIVITPIIAHTITVLIRAM